VLEIAGVSRAASQAALQSAPLDSPCGPVIVICDVRFPSDMPIPFEAIISCGVGAGGRRHGLCSGC